MNTVPIGRMIHTYIQENGLDLDRIVRESGLTSNRGRRLLSGEMPMMAEEYLAVCRALRLDADYFYRQWQSETTVFPTK